MKSTQSEAQIQHGDPPFLYVLLLPVLSYLTENGMRIGAGDRFWNGMPFLLQPHSLFEQVVFTSSMGHASIWMNHAQDQVFKQTQARCLCTAHSGSHRSTEADFGGRV